MGFAEKMQEKREALEAELGRRREESAARAVQADAGRVAEKEARREAKDAKAARKAQEAFDDTPEGQARIAHQRGDQWLELEMPMRDAGALNSYGDTGRDYTKRVAGIGLSRDPADVTDRISPIEAEGWDLTTAQYVYVMTGQDSREKWTSSGERVAVTGRIVGIYLFKRRELEAAA